MLPTQSASAFCPNVVRAEAFRVPGMELVCLRVGFGLTLGWIWFDFGLDWLGKSGMQCCWGESITNLFVLDLV